jgi:uncharacterized membrane protein
LAESIAVQFVEIIILFMVVAECLRSMGFWTQIAAVIFRIFSVTMITVKLSEV